MNELDGEIPFGASLKSARIKPTTTAAIATTMQREECDEVIVKGCVVDLRLSYRKGNHFTYSFMYQITNERKKKKINELRVDLS